VLIEPFKVLYRTFSSKSEELGRIKQINLLNFWKPGCAKSSSNRHCSTTGLNICRDSSVCVSAACRCIVVSVCGVFWGVAWVQCSAGLTHVTSGTTSPHLWVRLPIQYWEGEWGGKHCRFWVLPFRSWTEGKGQVTLTAMELDCFQTECSVFCTKCMAKKSHATQDSPVFTGRSETEEYCESKAGVPIPIQSYNRNDNKSWRRLRGY